MIIDYYCNYIFIELHLDESTKVQRVHSLQMLGPQARRVARMSALFSGLRPSILLGFLQTPKKCLL
jgi:hypothetical protein